MPRRPRKQLLRIQGAIDAMLPLGFTEQQVRKNVRQLLREYGGDDGWPFIEDGYYCELREALLRDVEGDELDQVARDGDQMLQDQDQMKDKSSADEEPAGISDRASDERPQENALADSISPETVLCTSDEKGWKDILPDQTTAPDLEETAILVTKSDEDPLRQVDSPKNSEITALPSPPLTNFRRRIPCYGWIESDDDDDNFITLSPMTKSICR